MVIYIVTSRSIPWVGKNLETTRPTPARKPDVRATQFISHLAPGPPAQVEDDTKNNAGFHRALGLFSSVKEISVRRPFWVSNQRFYSNYKKYIVFWMNARS